MKQGRTMAEITREIEMLDRTKRDLKVPCGKLRMSPDAERLIIEDAPFSSEAVRMSLTFHSQLGQYLGIPQKYYEKMGCDKPQLLSYNVNSWLEGRKDERLIRTMDYGNGQTARAFLSKKYRRIDNKPVMDALQEVFGGSQYTVGSAEMTANMLWAKILNKRIEREVVPGDYVQAGVMVVNSEVGLSGLRLVPVVYRLVCTNGMVVNAAAGLKLWYRRHIGREITISGSDVMTELKEAAGLVLDEDYFDRIVDVLAQSTQKDIKTNPEILMERLSKSFGVSKAEQEGILRNLYDAGDYTLYGLSNAITHYSQEAATYDRATILEGIGWEAVSMPAREWEKLNAA